MTDDAPSTTARELGREAFGTAVGLAVVVGALSVVLPAFDALTGTLVALAVAGWASGHRRGNGAPRWRPGSIGASRVALAVLGIAVAGFVDPPPPIATYRGLALGLGVVPLWWAERRRPRGRQDGSR